MSLSQNSSVGPRPFAFGLVAAALLCTGSGCSVYHGEFSVLSNRVLDLKDFDPRAARAKAVYAEGTQVRKIIVLFPTMAAQPTLDAAIDDALSQGEGDLTLDTQVVRWAWYIPYVYGSAGWRVVGDVVDTGSGGDKVPQPPAPTGLFLTTAER